MKILLTRLENAAAWAGDNGARFCFSAMRKLGCVDVDKKYVMRVQMFPALGFAPIYLKRDEERITPFWEWSFEENAPFIEWDCFLGRTIDYMLDKMFPGQKNAVIWVRISELP